MLISYIESNQFWEESDSLLFQLTTSTTGVTLPENMSGGTEVSPNFKKNYSKKVDFFSNFEAYSAYQKWMYTNGKHPHVFI